MTRETRVNWGRLRSDVESALRSSGLFPAQVRVDGRVHLLECGRGHRNYLFRVATDGPAHPACEPSYVLRIPAPVTDGRAGRESADRLRREAATLQALASADPAFATPRFVCFVQGAAISEDAFIETALPGLGFDFLRDQLGDPCRIIEMIAGVARGVHQLPVERFPFLPGHASSRAHVLARLAGLDPDFIARDPDAAACVAWIRAHLPEDRPAVVLHGDLLPQNLLWDLGSERVGVVDWEFAAIGDAAYDLAITTRGNAKLLGVGSGLRRLVAAYRAAGGVALAPADVIQYELLMHLGWLEQSLQAVREGRQSGYSIEDRRRQLRAILRRARAR